MTTPRRAPLARLAALGVALALPAAGCQSTAGKTAVRPNGRPAEKAADLKADRSADPHVARAGFDSALSAEQRVHAHFDLARAFEAQGKPDAAIAEYRSALDTFAALGRPRGDAPARARLHRRVAVASDRLGKFDQAREHYQVALRLTPKEPNLWNDAGYSAYLQGRWPEAEKALRRAAELDPSNPRILTNLGLALAASGKTDEALEVLTRAGGPASAHANLAYVLASTEQHQAARQHYATALAHQRDLPTAHEGLRRLDAQVASSSPTAPADPAVAGARVEPPTPTRRPFSRKR